MSTATIINQLPFLSSRLVLVSLAALTTVFGIVGSGLPMMVLFYVLLIVWSFLLTYRLVILSGVAASTINPIQSPTHSAVAKRPDLFAETVVVAASAPAAVPVARDYGVPSNLPVVGYNNVAPTTEGTYSAVEDKEVDVAYELEEQAHRARVLLSSDALRHFLATVPDNMKVSEAMAAVIDSAKQRYPSEDGWVVINEERMGEVCMVCLTSAFPATSNEAPYAPTVVPEGTGSLAEMIASSNVGAAFALIGHRPMFALSDAVADFDALYRQRKGEATHVSALLIESTKNLSDDTLRQVMSALTSALDGMYNDEAEAVKTAIMKAVKVRG